MKPRKPILISKFGGIAPKFGSNLKTGMAVVAENVDLSSEKNLPIKSLVSVTPLIEPYNSLFHNGTAWMYGNNKDYIKWPIGSNTLLLSLDSGTAQKTVGAVTANLGQTPTAAPSIANLSAWDDYSDDTLFEWRESKVYPGSYFVINRGSLDNYLADYCTSLSGWTDQDNGTGATSTVQPIVQYTGEELNQGFRLLSGNATAGNYARIYRTTSTFQGLGDCHISIMFYITSVQADDGHRSGFSINVSTSVGTDLDIRICSDGIFAYTGSAWVNIGACPSLDAFHNMVIVYYSHINAPTRRAEIYIDSVRITATYADVGSSGNGTIGDIRFTMGGGTDGANRTVYIIFALIGSQPIPPNILSKGEPGRVTINGEAAVNGTLGALNSNEWDFGYNLAEGVKSGCLYAKWTLPSSDEYVFTASSVGTNEYYITKIAGGDPDLGDARSLMIDGRRYTRKLDSAGSLSAQQWSLGNKDDLAFITLYFEMADSSDPNIGVHKFMINRTRKTRIDINKLNPEIDESTLGAGWVPGNITGAVSYVVVKKRSVGGHVDYSGPSPVSSEVVCDADQVRITKPTISDANVTHWLIYRLSAGSFQFVAEVAVATASYDDNIASQDLGASLDTEYTSDQGNLITFAAPPTALEGMFGPHSGMIFFFKGATLYWTEPGYPDACSGYYSMNFPANIKRGFVINGTLAILTEIGPFRVDGTHPELLQPSQVLGDYPCISKAACKTSDGIYYLSHGGIALFNLFTSRLATLLHFTEDWFLQNIAADSTNYSKSMIEYNGRVFLFHSTGALINDIRSGLSQWTTMDLAAQACHKNISDGLLYVIGPGTNGICKLFSGTTYESREWKSGDLLGDSASIDKLWISCEVTGSGDITLKLYVDGTLVATKVMDLDSTLDRDTRLLFPEETYGKGAQVEVTGTGIVNEILVNYSE